MRAARLIKMVLLLQSRPAMTAAELARELEVSERTITRDAQALSEAGVPVYADRGRAGGYRLVGGYRTRLTGLARNEAEALFLSGLPSALREMGLEDAASAARLKVSAALLPSLRDASDTAAQRFHLDAPGWYQEPVTPELLPAVAEAVWDDRMVKARYRRGGPGSEVERELAPYGLVLKAGVWYVCARAGTDFRVYRIDRFAAVAVTDERFVRDEDFDLAGVLGRAGRAVRPIDPADRGDGTGVGGGRRPIASSRGPFGRPRCAGRGKPARRRRVAYGRPAGRVAGCRLQSAARPGTGVGGARTGRSADPVRHCRRTAERSLSLKASFRRLCVHRLPPRPMLVP